MHTIKANLQYDVAAIRREVFEGVEHIVVPVVMIVEGVLNGALLVEAEFGKYVDSWNGRPVPVLHPEKQGSPVSANAPDVIERNSIGVMFNAFVDNGKLKGEAWINTDKAQRLGYSDLVAALVAGEVIEVSTGYFSDSEAKAGEFNGETYTEIHRNIRPDHLALLPGEIGACSVADGCGTRVNSAKGLLMSTKQAFNTLAQALGLRTNCNCNEDDQMDIMKKAEALKANGAVSAKQFQMLQEMDEEGRNMMAALIQALAGMPGEEDDPEAAAEDDEGEELPAEMQNQRQKTYTEADISSLVANQVGEQMRRVRVTDKLTANEACAFDEGELATMSVAQLEKYEKSIRPTDYSGAGGFASNSDAGESNVQPLRAPVGVIRGKQKEA